MELTEIKSDKKVFSKIGLVMFIGALLINGV